MECVQPQTGIQLGWACYGYANQPADGPGLALRVHKVALPQPRQGILSTQCYALRGPKQKSVLCFQGWSSGQRRYCMPLRTQASGPCRGRKVEPISVRLCSACTVQTSKSMHVYSVLRSAICGRGHSGCSLQYGTVLHSPTLALRDALYLLRVTCACLPS